MAHLYIVARLRGEVADGCQRGDARSLVAVYSRYPVVHPPVGKNNGVCRHTGVFLRGLCGNRGKGRVVVWKRVLAHNTSEKCPGEFDAQSHA